MLIEPIGRESEAHPAISIGHGVLIGEESVVGFELDLMPLAHGAGKQRRTEFPARLATTGSANKNQAWAP
jgi:hypothetical protein